MFPTEVALSSCIIARGEPATGELFSRDISRGSGLRKEREREREIGIIGRKNMRATRFRSSLAEGEYIGNLFENVYVIKFYYIRARIAARWKLK